MSINHLLSATMLTQIILGVFAVVSTDELGPLLGLADAFDGLEYGISNEHAYGSVHHQSDKVPQAGVVPFSLAKDQ